MISAHFLSAAESKTYEMCPLNPDRISKKSQGYSQPRLETARPSFELCISSDETSPRSSFASTTAETTPTDDIPFPHYNPQLAEIYKRTLNTSDYVQQNLIDVANADTTISITAIDITATDVSLHSIIDTINCMIHDYSKNLVKKSTDSLYILYINGLRFIGQKALQIAAHKGDVEKVKILIDHHVRTDFAIHTEDKSGTIRTMSLVDFVQQKGHTDMVRLLMKHANP